jgi:hypothetical protein
MDEHKLNQIGSRKDFHDAIRAALVLAADADAGEICLVDADFQDWPLNERAVVEALARWATSRRKLVIYAHSFDALPRIAPRFTEWRRQWSHIVQCRTTPTSRRSRCRPCCWCRRVSRRLLDPVRYAAWCRACRPTRWRHAKRLTRFCNDRSKPFPRRPWGSREHP